METDVFDFIDCSYSKLIDESITKSFHISILKILGLRIFEKYTTTPHYSYTSAPQVYDLSHTFLRKPPTPLSL